MDGEESSMGNGKDALQRGAVVVTQFQEMLASPEGGVLRAEI